MSIDNISRLKLGYFPTPLDEAPRLAAEIGLKRLFIKRDDQTGMALGGNKVRKLEYLMAEAIRQGCDVVMTVGGPQSNHARLTAAAARLLGLDAVLFLGGPRFNRFAGNLLLDILVGAQIKFIPDGTVAQLQSAMEEAAEELRKQGRHPFVIPFGGSTPHGALGYASAMHELSEQLGDEKNPQIVLAVGSGGTLSGVTLGAKMFLPGARVIGIAVARSYKPFEERCCEVANGAAELIGEDPSFCPECIEVYNDYLGDRYGVPTEASNEAIFLAARTEVMVLDPVYTGKAMAGMIDLTKKGIIDSNRTTVFLHTGGSPALFANEDCFRKFADYTELHCT
jgi:D-cysteine desulfhydrase